jgi:hypothetical protein
LLLKFPGKEVGKIIKTRASNKNAINMILQRIFNN